MLNVLLLMALVGVMTAMWPINKFATKNGARPETLGMMTCVSGLVLSILYQAFSGNSWGNWKIWGLGLLGGFAYAMGFFVLITGCLKIGPVGLTTAMNNMGMVGPLILGLLFFGEVKNFSLLKGLGFAGIILCVILLALQSSGKNGSVSFKWFRMAFGGWLLSCMSLGCQYLSSRVEPNGYLLYTVAYFASALVILLVITVVRFRSGPNRTEILAGLPSGILASLETPLSMFLVTQFPAFVLYPVSVTLPMILVLLIGRIFLKEHMNRTCWIACIIGVLGMVAINL